jgi:hypothetical protein
MKIGRRILLAVVTGIVALIAASATTGAPSFAATSSQATHIAKHPHAAPAAVVPRGIPTGCPSGDFCVYTGYNGNGHRCSFVNNAPTLGACTNNNESVVNVGTPCAGCQDINLHWGESYEGAFYCLPPGHYLDIMDNNYFNRVGSVRNGVPGNVGLGESMGDNTASGLWSGSC